MTNQKKTIIINNDTIDDKIVQRLIRMQNCRFGIDMKNVKNIKSKLFIKLLITDKFKLFNLKNEILLYLSLILKDGKLKSFMNFDDFKNDKRELIRRKFFSA